MAEEEKIINYIKVGKKKTPIYQLREPFEEEMERIRTDELSKEGIHFAYQLEILENNQAQNETAVKAHKKVSKEANKFYTRYSIDKNLPSLGITLTNIDFNRIERHPNGEPIIWEMGSKRRMLALAQRALFFDENVNKDIFKIIDNITGGKQKIPPRSNRRSATVDKVLGITSLRSSALYTPAIIELGYKKISSERILSRREIVKTGLFNKVGKYPRKIIGLGAMPPVSGWRDTIVTSAVGHMVSFIPRSSIYASDQDRRIQLAIESFNVINNLKIPEEWKKKIGRNIGAALGAENPEKEVKIAKRFYDEAQVKLFRIYTIGSDIRVVKTAHKLRQHFGDEIEIFVGQIADKRQALALAENDIKVEGLIYGHGGGQQCTSAINGMALSTLEDIYEASLDPKLNNTSILVEGGLARSLGTALILGVDCDLGNQKFIRGSIETWGLFLQDKKGRLCQPYPGTASPVTQIIESKDPDLRIRRTDAAGRTYYSEGKPGFMYYEEKANSMTFWINEYLRHAARALADLNVKNIAELRQMSAGTRKEHLRILSEKTQYLSEPHWKLD